MVSFVCNVGGLWSHRNSFAKIISCLLACGVCSLQIPTSEREHPNFSIWHPSTILDAKIRTFIKFLSSYYKQRQCAGFHYYHFLISSCPSCWICDEVVILHPVIDFNSHKIETNCQIDLFCSFWNTWDFIFQLFGLMCLTMLTFGWCVKMSHTGTSGWQLGVAYSWDTPL